MFAESAARPGDQCDFSGEIKEVHEKSETGFGFLMEPRRPRRGLQDTAARSLRLQFRHMHGYGLKNNLHVFRAVFSAAELLKPIRAVRERRWR